MFSAILNFFLHCALSFFIFVFVISPQKLLYAEPVRSKSERYLNIFIPKGNVFVSLDLLTADASGKVRLPKDFGDILFVYQFIQTKTALSVSTGLFDRFSLFAGIPLVYRRFSGGQDLSSQIGIPKTSVQTTLEKIGLGDLEIGFETLLLRTEKLNIFSQFGVKIPTSSVKPEYITGNDLGTSNGQSDFSALFGLMIKEKVFFVNISSAYIFRTPYEILGEVIYPGEEIFFEPGVGVKGQNLLTGVRFPLTYLVPNSSGITSGRGSLPIEKSYSLSGSYFLTYKFSDNFYASVSLSLTLAESNPLFLIFPTFSKYPEGTGVSSLILVGYYF